MVVFSGKTEFEYQQFHVVASEIPNITQISEET